MHRSQFTALVFCLGLAVGPQGAAPLAAEIAPAFTTEEINAARAAFVAGDFSVIALVAVPAAAAGDASAQNLLGVAYQMGSGVPRDLELALEWYRRAADQGLDRAQDNLARTLLGDDPEVLPDPAAARHYLDLAIAQDFAASYCTYARALLPGGVFPEDIQEALQLSRRGAELGDPDCAMLLGWLFNISQLVKPNLPEARAAFARADELGNITGTFYVAQMMSRGEGGPVDVVGAVAVYERAMLKGSEYAAFAAAMLVRDMPDLFTDDPLLGLAFCHLALRTSLDGAIAKVTEDCAAYARGFSAQDRLTAANRAAEIAPEIALRAQGPNVILGPDD